MRLLLVLFVPVTALVYRCLVLSIFFSLRAVPEMVASQVGVYNGLGYTLVEIKPDMIGHYLGEFSITYKPCRHGKASKLLFFSVCPLLRALVLFVRC